MKFTRMHTLAGLLVVVPLFTSIYSQERAKQTTSSFFEKLTGNWETQNGKSFGLKSQVTLACETTLGNKFTRLDYLIVMPRDSGKTQQFEGTGFYRVQSDSACDGTWFDSEGAMHPLRGTLAPTLLSTLWGTDSGTLGRTVYRFVPGDSLEIIDSVRGKNGKWREFSRNTLGRK